ncbi:phosphomannose isomerase type II C-terminal cupin domain [Nostocoides veronense]
MQPSKEIMSPIPDPRPEMFVEERPWGGFEQLTLNEQTTVKILTIVPGARLSLQTHTHRAEFWRVLDGPLEVTIGDETVIAEPGDSFWIPLGALHRVGNTSDNIGRILEIAYGSFDESDIQRLHDDYAR